MKITSSLPLVFLTLALSWNTPIKADTFGSGTNSFTIDFVTIGNPGNAADPDDGSWWEPGLQNYGAVDSTFRIGKYEISESMIDKANALGGLGITHSSFGENKPVTFIDWYEAARFVNWLNTNSGSTPAYKFNGDEFQLWQPGDTGYDPDNLYRNSQARFFLPSNDEWHKAAFYDPAADVYYDYPTGSDSIPDGLDFFGDPVYDAVYTDSFTHPGVIPAPYDIKDAGKLSPYGTAGQGGNAQEWLESPGTQSIPLDYLATTDRAVRGGAWDFIYQAMDSTSRGFGGPSNKDWYRGFRIASLTIPEPGTLLLVSVASLGLLIRGQRLS